MFLNKGLISDQSESFQKDLSPTDSHAKIEPAAEMEHKYFLEQN